MRKFILACLLPTGCLAILVTVPDTTRYTTMFASVTMRCDYSTSANMQLVVVTWRYKSFCRDPILDYYSSGYQAALALGQDPVNDCPDSQREVRTVIQKTGTNEPILGVEYAQRKITIQNKADLVINEVMWWDNGVYFCIVEAPGDTAGDPDKEVKLIVYNWLVVIFIILGFLLLIILLSICWCQCCPHRCCCYVRCPCCPTKCCCPEKAIIQHRIMKEAKKALMPWSAGHIYDPVGSYRSSSHHTPQMLKDYSLKHHIPMIPMQQQSHHSNKSVLDYLESQVRNLDTVQPLQQPLLPSNHVQFQTPPSVLSSLNEIGVREIDRRVIHLPPIVERIPSSHSTNNSARRNTTSSGFRGQHSEAELVGRGVHGQGGSRSSRGSHSEQDNRNRRREPQNNNRNHWRDQYSHPRDWRSYSDESDYDDRRGGPNMRRNNVGSYSQPRQEREQYRDDYNPGRHRPRRRQRSYSPPGRRGSWSSDDDSSRAAGNNRRRNKDHSAEWPEKPPSYRSIEILPDRSHNGSNRVHERYSERSSRSGRSVVL
ncbi:immunoglobulin-like domain-containing receptor 1a [Polypterus senegalus]|uniref:immunoglobulin-like domain-containing receptor 1a n=1 Tax=Polypterus senegalus TaxID=55291 RepID=UPI001964D568|nr:immunoglobulin-like domain-containing receptor 1a [Polypterus senegalus]